MTCTPQCTLGKIEVELDVDVVADLRLQPLTAL